MTTIYNVINVERIFKANSHLQYKLYNSSFENFSYCINRFHGHTIQPVRKFFGAKTVWRKIFWHTKNWVMSTCVHEKRRFCAHELSINLKIIRRVAPDQLILTLCYTCLSALKKTIF